MGVEGSADSSAILAAVEKAGYGAKLQEKKAVSTSSNTAGASSTTEGSDSFNTSAEEELLKDRESPKLIKRLTASLGFLLLLMYVSMGHTMWGWPLPSWFNGNHVAMGLLQLLLAAIIMLIKLFDIFLQ